MGPRKRSESTFHRLMLGLSISDLLSSFFPFFLSTWPMPQGYLKYAVGSVTSCDVVGFFFAFTCFTCPIYNCSLATYFLVRLKYNWQDCQIKAMEKWLHIIPWLVGMVPAVVGLVMKAFGPLNFHCGVTPSYPIDCDKPESSIECKRGGTIFYNIFNLLTFVNSLLTMGYVFVTMFIVYRAIRTIEDSVKRYSMTQYRRRPSTLSLQEHQRTKDGNKRPSLLLRQHRGSQENRRSSRILEQGILYSTILIVVHLFPCMQFFYYLATGERSYVILVLTYIFHPIQGFYNAVIYSLIPFRMYNRNREQRSSILFSTMGAGVGKLRQSLTKSMATLSNMMKGHGHKGQELPEKDDTMEEEHDEEQEGGQGRREERKEEEPAIETMIEEVEKQGGKMSEPTIGSAVLDDETNLNFVLVRSSDDDENDAADHNQQNRQRDEEYEFEEFL